MLDLSESEMKELQLVSTIVLAAIAALIAYRQYSLQATKLKFELFERRERIYRAAERLVMHSMNTLNPTNEEIQEFREARQPARWLFGDDIWQLLRHLEDVARRTQHPQNDIRYPAIHFDQAAVDRATEFRKNKSAILLATIAKELPARFSPYLKLDRSWKSRFSDAGTLLAVCLRMRKASK